MIELLMGRLGEPLFCFLYEYTVLGAIFFAGLAYGVRQGDVGFSTRLKRRHLFILVGGYFLYMGIHGLFQFVLAPMGLDTPHG